MPIKLLPHCVLLACAAWAMQAPAAGLGVALGNPQLGQPLDFSVQLRTDPTETLAPECVSAEVLVGERRVPPAWVRAALEVLGPESARVRVLTTQAVDEPVVTVNVSVGCQSRVSRRYVLLVDLPVAQPAAPAFAAVPAEAPAAGPAGALPGAPNGAASTTPSAAPATATAGRPARAAAARRSEAPRRPRRVATAPPPPRAEPAPRLRLEVAEPPPRSAEAIAVERAIEAVAQAASAARAAASAASAAQARVAALEREVGDLRGQAHQQSEAAAELRRQLEASRGSTRWLLPLVLLVLALAALAMWLAWRLTQLQKQREAAWRQVVAPPPAGAPASAITPSRQPTAPIPFVTSEIAPPAAPSRPRGSAPAWPPPAPPPRPVWPESIPPPAEARADAPADPQRTQPLAAVPVPAAVEAGTARDVTIEELIDLEQQAEFFVVLGQEEAAIDLLVEHLRHTGGGSPLPYLKLLEIDQRRGDREAYERMRSRFNQRFNAYAPEWGADLAAGRTLEDYPGVVPRLAQVWPRPLDAMAELEALLFRRSRGELFELPAYREILFLYSVARDLLDREAADPGDVDLLLPMAEGTGFGVTTPHPYLGLESDAMPLARPGDDTPTLPLDLDLTGRRQSLFGELDPESRPPRR